MAKVYLEVHEVERLEKEAAYLRDRLLVRILFRLGCRISEVLNLTVDDVDFDNRTVLIDHLKRHRRKICFSCGERQGMRLSFYSRCGNKISGNITEKTEHRRQKILPVDNETLSMLREYIERGGPVERGGKLLIFGITRFQAWRIVKQCGEKAWLPKLINPETGRAHNVSPRSLRDSSTKLWQKGEET